VKRLPIVLGAAAALAVPATANAADGAVRVLHASPDAPAVDVYVDGQRVVADVGRGELTPYLQVDKGRHTYAVRVAGARRTSPPVLTGAFRVADDSATTIAATGLLRRGTLRIRTYADAAARPFGSASIRVVHLSPDAPKVDVVVDGIGKVVSGLAYRKVTRYLTLAAGTYTVRVRPAGTRTDAIVLKNVRLRAGELSTAWALGLAAPERGEMRLRGRATVDRLPAAYARTQLRVLHASPGAPAVDVDVNGEPAVPGLAFGVAAPADGGYLRLPSGPVDVRIRVAGTQTAVFEQRLTLPPQATLTVAARGVVGSTATPFGLAVLPDDVSPLAAGQARVTVAHLAPDVPPVDVFAGEAKVVDGASFPSASGALTVPAADYVFSVRPQGTALALPLTATLAAGTATTVYAIGLVGNGSLAFKALVTPIR